MVATSGRTAIAILIAATLVASCSDRAADKDQHLKQANEAFAAGQYGNAEKLYREVLKIDPQNAAAQARLGAIFFDQGQALQAYPLLQRSAKQEPENVDIQLKLGLAALSIGRFAEARELAQQILEKQPGHQLSLFLLASAAVTSVEIEEVRKLVQEFQRDNKLAGPHLALGTLYLRQKQFANAEKEFTAAIKLDPKSEWSHAGLATTHWRQGNLPAAEQAFNTAAELSPARSAVRIQQISFLVSIGATDRATKLLEGMRQRTPDALPPRVWLMKLACSERQDDACTKQVREILAQDSLNSDALFLDGLFNLASGDSAKAIREFEFLANTFTANEGPTRYRLALAYLLHAKKSQNQAEARKFIETGEKNLADAVKLEPQLEPAVLLFAELKIRNGASAAAIDPLVRLLKGAGKKNPKAHSLLATAYLTQNDRQQALAVYRQMTDLFPEDPQPSFLIGSLLLEQGQTAQARAAFEKAAAISPDFLLAVERLVELDLRDKQYASATERVKNIFDKQSNSAVAWVLRAKVFSAQGDFSQSETDLRKAIQINPKLEVAHLMLAQTYVGLKKREQAVDALQTYLKDNEKSIPALTLLATLHEQGKNSTGAREAYERILSVRPNSVFALNNLAAIQLNLGRLDEAAKLAQKAREINPREPHVADTLGWILLKKGELQNARRLLTESAARLPNHPEVQYHLAMSYYMLGEVELARAAFENAAKSKIEFRGRDDIAQRLTFLSIKPTDSEARDELERFLKQQPNDPIAMTRLAQVLQAKGATEEAIQLYEKVVSSNASFGPALRELALIYSKRSSSAPMSFEITQSARRAYPQDPEIARALGIANFRRSIYPRAIELLKEATAKLPGDAEILYYLGQAHYELKQPKECQAVLERVVSSPEQNKFASEAKRTLEQCTEMLAPPQ